MTEYRAVFDARVTFRNGGALQVEGFRVDVPSAQTGEDEVAALLLASLGLLMAERVQLSALRIVEEAHKGTRGGPADRSATPMTAGRRLVELSHPITAGMTTYPGLPGPRFEPHLGREDSRGVYAPGTEFQIDRITMVGNTGTYLDSPFHRYADGDDLAGIGLERLADLPAVVVRTVGGRGRAVGVEALAAHDVRDRAVLLHTGGDRHWGTAAYAGPGPFLTEAGAAWLVANGAVLVGIDAVNIDDTAPESGGARHAHSTLLAAGVPIVEHLTALGALPPTGARFTSAPPRIAGVGTFPVRAWASVPDTPPRA